MRLSIPVFKLKRQARLLTREIGIPYNKALDELATKHGFRSWSHLSASISAGSHGEKILPHMQPGDLVLLGARPGHGKTLLGLEILSTAIDRGKRGYFFTLDYTALDVSNRLETLEINNGSSLIVDTSDAISADYIIGKLENSSDKSLVVIDYLQLLDQDRKKPALSLQIRTLKSFAEKSETIIIILSQIDRSFDLQNSQMPSLSDIRLPNPVDLKLFSNVCFLHNGEIEFSSNHDRRLVEH